MTKAGGRGAYVVSGVSGGTMCLLLRPQNSLSDISLAGTYSNWAPKWPRHITDRFTDRLIPNSIPLPALIMRKYVTCLRNLLPLSRPGNRNLGFERFDSAVSSCQVQWYDPLLRVALLKQYNRNWLPSSQDYQSETSLQVAFSHSCQINGEVR